MAKENIYKLLNADNNSIFPGNPQGLPDESLPQEKTYKPEKIVNNIQVPGMTRKGNAGLPILSKIKQKVYKPRNFGSNNMYPGDPKGSPDEFFSKDTVVFIDGAFLEKLSKHFGKGVYLKFDRILLAIDLAKKQNLICKHLFYYTAPPFQSENSSEKERSMKEGYDKFIFALSKDKNIIIRQGRCQRIINSKGEIEYNQKGVDVLLTIDLSYIKQDFPEINKVILVSSDTDFCPVIRDVKKRGDIEVILYTYFDRTRNSKFSLSNELISCCSKYVRLTKEDFKNSPLNKEVKNDK